MLTEFTSLPIIDISPLLSALQEPSGRCSGPPGTSEAELVMQQIDEACREVGFFYITGHGVSEELQGRMEQQAQHFFTLPQVRGGHVSLGGGPGAGAAGTTLDRNCFTLPQGRPGAEAAGAALLHKLDSSGSIVPATRRAAAPFTLGKWNRQSAEVAMLMTTITAPFTPPGNEAGHPHEQGWAGVARLLPYRGGAHLREARHEGGRWRLKGPVYKCGHKYEKMWTLT